MINRGNRDALRWRQSTRGRVPSTRSWVSSGRSSESIERLRREIAELEEKRNELMERNKKKVFDWASFAVNSRDRKVEPPADDEVKDVVAKYDFLSQSILEKEVSLNARLDEQAKMDSLG